MKKIVNLMLAGSMLSLAATGMAQADDKKKAEVFTSWTSGGEAKAVGVIRKEFEARGGEWEDQSIAGFDNAAAALQNRMVAGDPPAVNQAVVGKDQQEYIKAGLMTPITDIAKAENWQSVLPASLYKTISYKGQVYLAPTDIHGESWMFYSLAAFKKAGISGAPTTWDAFFADMDKLKAAGLIPIAWGGQAWQETKVFNMILASQVGMDGFNKIYQDADETVLKSDGVRKALQIFGKMRDYIDEGAPGRNWNDATAMVITGKAGVQLSGDWAKGEFTDAGQKPGVDYGCDLVPASPGLIYIADAFDFPKVKDAGTKAAQTLMAQVVMDPKVQRQFSVYKGSMPPRKDVDTADFDICSQKGIKLMKEDKIMPEQAITITPEQSGMLDDFVSDFFANPDADLDDAMSQFADIFQQ